ncbi:MAG TPA: Gfo/Idh/MocA family oxidoreductase [Longimicrobiales bacterium]|nr:Gfo/Idh/MocA family oxidoreductase [Longimicrobiales bacterium]
MSTAQLLDTGLRSPRLGFLGTGWIGRARMQTLAVSGAGSVAAIADTSPERAADALADAPDAVLCDSLDALLDQELDGIVIATPSALHAEQAVLALESGVAVFCQKPLGRTAAETARVIDAAREADLLLGVDLSYRWTSAMRAVREAVRSGVVGDVFSVDLVFHNAYGPDKGWARDPALAGGGCAIDLGIHLLDLAFWTLDAPVVTAVRSELYAHGRRLPPGTEACEDYATATVELAGGATLRLTCSWEVSVGRDAIIDVTFHGSDGAVGMHNIDGSFFDFVAEQYRGTSVTRLTEPPDAWPGRALIEWSRSLAVGGAYDASIETIIPVAATLDAVLGR